jgi:hypothetical protein
MSIKEVTGKVTGELTDYLFLHEKPIPGTSWSYMYISIPNAKSIFIQKQMAILKPPSIDSLCAPFLRKHSYSLFHVNQP